MPGACAQGAAGQGDAEPARIAKDRPARCHVCRAERRGRCRGQRVLPGVVQIDSAPPPSPTRRAPALLHAASRQIWPLLKAGHASGADQAGRATQQTPWKAGPPRGCDESAWSSSKAAPCIVVARPWPGGASRGGEASLSPRLARPGGSARIRGTHFPEDRYRAGCRTARRPRRSAGRQSRRRRARR